MARLLSLQRRGHRWSEWSYSTTRHPTRSATQQHIELCRPVPGATFRHGPVFGAPMGEPQHQYYAEFEWPDEDVVQGGRVVRRVRGDRRRTRWRWAAGSASSSRGSRRSRLEALGEPRLALLAHGRNALVHVGARQVEELERERRVEGRPGGAQPVVERELRVADRGLRAFGEPRRDLERACLELVLGDAERDEPDALGLDAVERLAEQQVVLRLRQAAEQRPDDRRMVARRDAQLRVPVDDSRAGVAIEMSASSPTASPAPTAGPVIAETIGLEQSITL